MTVCAGSAHARNILFGARTGPMPPHPRACANRRFPARKTARPGPVRKESRRPVGRPGKTYTRLTAARSCG